MGKGKCDECGLPVEHGRVCDACGYDAWSKTTKDQRKAKDQRKELSSPHRQYPALPIFCCVGYGVLAIWALVAGQFQQFAAVLFFLGIGAFIMLGHNKRTLVPCEACGKMVSDIARICFNCGNPQ